MADDREHQQGGEPRPGQQGHEREGQEHRGQPEPGQQHPPGRMTDADAEPERGRRDDQESGKPVQLDEPDRQQAE
jgi:hypothetical protein